MDGTSGQKLQYIHNVLSRSYHGNVQDQLVETPFPNGNLLSG